MSIYWPLFRLIICRPARYCAIRIYVGRRDGIHEIRHAGIVGAATVTEISHRLLQILVLLAGQPRRRSVALELIEMAGGAAD